MERLGIYLFFLIILLSPALYSLEEQSFQAKILIEEREEPYLIFPLSRPDFKELKESFLRSGLNSEYFLYTQSLPAESDTKDLCGFLEPDPAPPEGEIL